MMKVDLSSDEKRTLDSALHKYANVFREGMGILKDTKVDIPLDHDAKPKFFKAPPVPYVLCSKVETELDHL